MAETTSYNTVVGYFASEQSAEAAVQELKAAGFRRDQIGVAGRPDEEGFSVSDRRSSDKTAYEEGHKAGKAAGGFWQRIRNLFESDAPEPYAEESSRGDWATREATDNYDYDSSDFHQSLGSSVPEERSRYFSGRFGREGRGVLVTVEAGDRQAEAEAILEKNGGDLGRDSSAWASQQSENTSAEAAPRQRIQLYGEVLRVHRDRVRRGEVRLRKETVTETRNVEVPVTREELVLERVPVTGQQAAPDARIGEGSEIRVPLSEDRVSIEKEPVVREEVNIGKREVTNVESHDEKVRREELRVDDETTRKAS